MGNENTGRKMSRTFGHRGKQLPESCSTPILQKSRVHDESDRITKEFPTSMAKKAMRTENKISRTAGPRKRLADITNTPLLPKSRAHEEDDQMLQDLLAQLQDELTDVKKMLSEKEVQIEENKSHMQKLWLNYCRKTKQNDEIILHNSQLSKDLTQALDKLKVLEHENVQMSALYKFCKSEVQQKQEKLTEAMEEVDRLTKLLEASRSEEAMAVCGHPSVEPGEIADGGGGTCASIHGRSVLRKRQRMQYKQPSLKQKMRQAEGEVFCTDPLAAAQNQGKAESREAADPTTRKQELVPCDHTTAARELRKAEAGGEAVTGYGKRELVESDATGTVQPWTGKEETGRSETEQVRSEAHMLMQKLCERPLRRAASSIGSYKEPPLNTKMRRAA